MKLKIMMFGVLLPLIFLVGCMTERQVGEIRTFSEKVDGYQAVVAAMKEELVKDKVISENTAAKVDKVNEWLDNNQPVLEKIATDVENAPDDVASKVATGISSAAPLIPPPYNNLALGLSTLIAVAFGKKAVDNGKALSKESGKRRSEKAGTEKTIRELATLPIESITADVVKEKLFTNIGDERARNGLT